jgi:hypothetical protein
MISEMQAISRQMRRALRRWVGGLQSADSPHDKNPLISFRCNICSASSIVPLSKLTREEPTCHSCRSTVRMRSIIHVLSLELFGKSLTIDEFPIRPDIAGIGLSDWTVYADLLACKFRYTNTYLDREPKLDIRDLGTAPLLPVDFLIATDVFEHVAPPISWAFNNARRLLKSDGVLVFSVPYVNEPSAVTREHFPDLNEYEVTDSEGNRALVNRTVDGRVQIFNDLVFHGGEGFTLEMRLFAERSLRDDFLQAGFDRLKFYSQPELRWGIAWPHATSLVLSARPALD